MSLRKRLKKIRIQEYTRAQKEERKLFRIKEDSFFTTIEKLNESHEHAIDMINKQHDQSLHLKDLEIMKLQNKICKIRKEFDDKLNRLYKMEEHFNNCVFYASKG